MVSRVIGNALRILSAVALTFSLSCDDQIFPLVDCNNYLSDEPSSATIKVQAFGRMQYYELTIVNVYEGTDTLGDLVYSYRPATETTYVDVALNRTYTFVATYQSSYKTYKAVDSATPRVKYTESECDEPCWYMYNNKVNLQIKYL
jgi:hypothetical protein